MQSRTIITHQASLRQRLCTPLPLHCFCHICIGMRGFFPLKRCFSSSSSESIINNRKKRSLKWIAQKRGQHFRMNECCDKYHSPRRTLLQLAGGRRSVDTGRPTVDGLVVLPDSGAAALWEDAEDAESRCGSWCKSAWCRSRRTPPTSNNSDTCIRGSRFRVWGKLSPAARLNKPRRLARVRRSRTTDRSRFDTGPSRQSRGGGTCSTGSRRNGPGRTGQADCRTDCWRWSVRRNVADGRTGAW
ncbi:hypothetical protein T4A_9688 [Trichinella pseudospiralis]|uniref:Uncharacterized protein n=1 Tax=Trichinella pseudospiralis TaxID=6337 RepID=A0A0V1JJY0_TRIPS|nr:hypothetical protein T4A_9688 [Trichinella pseudospiralis]KRZ35288.1 hypothetical protein T4C_12220 [Trichinella pseudospiralis]